MPVLDYHALVSTVLAFNVCEIRKCIEVTIENDRTLENNESIILFLDPFSSGYDERISLDPRNGEIHIIDDDGVYDIVHNIL